MACSAPMAMAPAEVCPVPPAEAPPVGLYQNKLTIPAPLDDCCRPPSPATTATPQSVKSGYRFSSQDTLPAYASETLQTYASEAYASEGGSFGFMESEQLPMTHSKTDIGFARRISANALDAGTRSLDTGLFQDGTHMDRLSPAHHTSAMRRQNSLPHIRSPSGTPTSRLLSRRVSAGATLQVDSNVKSPFGGIRRRHSSMSCRSRRSSASSFNFEFEPAAPWKDIQLLQEGRKIFDLFSWDEVLQEEGDGGKVVVCQPKGESSLPRKKYVMKMRSKESLQRDLYEEQFRKAQERLLNLPVHAGVLPVLEVLEDETHYYIIMECATGGAFLPSLLSEFKDGIMPEHAVKGLMREVLEAVGHVHSQGMLHRDIKPDNLVMQVQENEFGEKVRKVALIDFDHADPDFNPGTPCRGGFCGTVLFCAPEAIQGQYSQASDLYSVGVILYLLMTGKLPYPDAVFDSYYENIQLKQRMPCSPWQERRRNWKGAVLQKMKEVSLDWSCNPWPEVPACRDFCQSLLAFDVSERPVSAEAALASDWLASDWLA